MKGYSMMSKFIRYGFLWLATASFAVSACPSGAFADEALHPANLPRFSDYRVDPVYAGFVHHPMGLNDDDFRIKEELGSNGKVNFAGHYQLVLVTCGSACMSIAAMNAIDGKVSFFGSLALKDNLDPVSFCSNSRLIIVRGAVNDEMMNGSYHYTKSYYAFKSGKFVLLRHVSLSLPDPSDVVLTNPLADFKHKKGDPAYCAKV